MKAHSRGYPEKMDKLIYVIAIFKVVIINNI